MSRVPTEPNNTPTSIYNPSVKDFVYQYDIDGEHKQYVLHSLEITTLPKYLADHFANKMADELAQDKTTGTYEANKKALLEEIYVTI